MDQSTLISMASGYLKAEGYATAARGRDLIVGNRSTIGGELENFYVWIPRIEGAPGQFGSMEGPYLARFQEITALHPRALKFFLVPSLEGLSTDFRRGAKQWYGVSVTVPAQFFDTNFKWDSGASSSPVSTLRDEGHKLAASRVHQPYLESVEMRRGPDLLDDLAAVVRRRSAVAKPINFVTGPAGMGKSYLFKCLYSRLYSEFIADKQRLQISVRPIPLLPEHLVGAVSPHVRAGLQSCLQAEFERPLREEVFEWMLSNGMSAWLLDGLDEVIGRDSDFATDLLDYLTSPRAAGPSRPMIVICIRDSLFQSKEELRTFADEYRSLVSIYRLDRWDATTQEEYAREHLKGRSGQFMALVSQRPDVAELATLPYYCRLLVEDFAPGALDESYSEDRLLERAIRRLIDREREPTKGIATELLTTEEILDFAEVLAGADMERDFQGLSPTELKEYAELAAPVDVTEEQRSRLITHLTQFAFWTSGSAGRVYFAHEALEHYLVHRWLTRLLDTSAEVFMSKLDLAPLPADSITCRLLARSVRDGERAARLTVAAKEARHYPLAFKNAVQLLSCSGAGSNALRQVLFEGADLAGIRFEGVNLTGVSFKDADLSSTEFIDCVLVNTDFENTVLNNTIFSNIDGDALLGAEMGRLVRFASIRVDGRLIDSPSQARRWFDARTGRRGETIEPCAAARQLRHTFGKFVHLTGEFRRDQLSGAALVKGTRYIDPERVVNAALRAGYLIGPDYRGRVSRPVGDEYGEIVKFVTELQLSPGLRALLNEACDREGCDHVPAAL